MNSDDAEIKACCADFYQTDVVRLLLGDVLHPGGMELTEHLGEVLQLQQGERVLDIACGRGSSAILLAERFGCHVTGLDYSEDSLARARARAEAKNMTQVIHFEPGDAEELPVEDGRFDVVISECSLCTFPNKETATREMARVLRSGGRVGITDVTVNGPLPEDIQSVLAWVTCLAGAGAVSDYVSLLANAGFDGFITEDRSKDGSDMIADMRRKLTGLALAARIGKVETANLDIKGTRDALKRVEDLIESGTIGYALIAAKKK
ncbi:MAG: methyltransferase domain-containing protein [Chloroflexota bacterium]